MDSPDNSGHQGGEDVGRSTLGQLCIGSGSLVWRNVPTQCKSCGGIIEVVSPDGHTRRLAPHTR